MQAIENPMIVNRRQCHAWRLAIIAGISAMSLTVTARSGHAQTRSVADVSSYQGADRSQRLQQGAKQEGELTLYTSMPNSDSGTLIAAFEQRFGVKVKIWRASSDVILQRVVSESKVGRIEADIIMMDATGIEPLRAENILGEIKSPAVAGLTPQAVPAHHQWVPFYLNGFVQAYNTNLIKKESLPHSWQDLLKPQWKGKLGIEAKDSDWFAEVVLSLGETEGLQLFRDIVARNGISVRSGHTVLTNLVASGEVPFGLTPYDYSVTQLKVKGAPIDWFLIPPAIARAGGIGIPKTAKHPNAAMLLLDFAIRDGQALLAARNYTTVIASIEPPFLKGPVKIIDPEVMLSRSEKWADLFKKTFLQQAR
jgi:iron(III) transport system substrate-binding protein